MRNLRIYLTAVTIGMLFSSCSLWSNLFKPKYGCPSNGKNVGAEKIISGDPDAMKSVKKAKKFKS